MCVCLWNRFVRRIKVTTWRLTVSNATVTKFSGNTFLKKKSKVKMCRIFFRYRPRTWYDGRLCFHRCLFVNGGRGYPQVLSMVRGTPPSQDRTGYPLARWLRYSPSSQERTGIPPPPGTGVLPLELVTPQAVFLLRFSKNLILWYFWLLWLLPHSSYWPDLTLGDL